MNKAVSFAIATVIFSSNAFAHGNLFEQASGVSTACLKFMMETEPKKLVRLFATVTTELTGLEQFNVTVGLKDGQKFVYKATGVDGEGDAFSWACAKQ